MAKGGAVRAGRAFVELFADNSKLVRGLKKARGHLKSFGSFATGAGAKLFAGAGLAAAPFAAMVKTFASMGDQLDKISARTGVTVETLSKLGFAAEQSGADVDTLEKGLGAMGRFMLDAQLKSKTATDNLKIMGLTMADLEGKTPDERIKLLLQRLAAIEDPSIRAGVAMKVLGRAGRQLLPMAENFDELAAQAKKFGLVMSKEDTKKAAELTDALNLLRNVLKMVFAQVGGALASGVIKAAKWIAEIGSKVITWVKGNKELIVTVVKIIGIVAAAGAGLMAAGLAAAALNAIIGLGIALWTGIGVAIGVVISLVGALLSPIGLVAAGIVGLLAYFVDWGKVSTDVTQKAGEDWGAFKDRAIGAWGGIRDAIAAGDLKLAFKIVTLFLKGEWLRIMGVLKQKWGQFVGFFQRMWANAVFATARVFTNSWAGLQKGWLEVTDALADAWAFFSGAIVRGWNTTVGFVKKSWEKLKSFVTGEEGRSSTDIDAETDAKNKANLDAQNKRIMDRERERAKALKGIEDERRATINALNSEQKRREELRKKNREQAIKENDEKIKQAQAELDALIGKAKDKKNNAGPGVLGGFGVSQALGISAAIAQKLIASKNGTADAITGKSSVVSTKTGFDRFSAGGSASGINGVRDELKKANGELKKIHKVGKQQVERTVPLQ